MVTTQLSLLAKEGNKAEYLLNVKKGNKKSPPNKGGDFFVSTLYAYC